MTLPLGSKLGPYEIRSTVGAGGMGEVYRARDARLGRDVAVKVLPTAFSADHDRLHRFEQEARSAGRISHPNILAIFDTGTHDGAPYIVSELLEGETLRDRIKAGAIPPRKAVEIGTQIAQGLAAAHDHGIVHRDLKPENVFVARDGHVKILDFGLAKLASPEREDQARPDAGTLLADTGPGAVWGTVGYMSPEQVRGNPVTHSSDLFAFGAILYEMLSGRRAFQGDSPADTMSAILKEDPPDLAEAVRGIPPGLERVVRHCLEKNPGERYQSARDLAFALETISGVSESRAVAALPARRARGPLALALAAIGAVAILTVALVLRGALGPRDRTQVMRVTLGGPEGSLARLGVAISISPDGRLVVFSAPDTSGDVQLWLRPLSATSAVAVPGTKDAQLPFWSPDSRHIGFFADEKLKRLPVEGGPARAICAARNGRGATWSEAGVIVFAPDATGALYRVAADGGQPIGVTSLDSTRHETAHRFPSFLPDGRHFLYVALPAGPDGELDTYLGSLDSKERKAVVKASDAATYAERGLVLFSRGDLLMAQRFDPRRGVHGEATMVAEAPNFSPTVGQPVVSVSRNDIAAYVAERARATALQWYRVTGEPLETVPAPAGRYVQGGVSPDGRRAVVVRRVSSSNSDLWLIDFERGTSSRLTFDPGVEASPVWSPDGRQIAFSSNREGGVNNLYVMPADGGEAEVLYRSAAQFKHPQAWSKDGRHILFYQLDPETGADLWLLSTTGEREAEPYLRTRFNESAGTPSPDGRWLAYASDESGQSEVYVQSFPRAGKKRQISTGGSDGAVWSRDGKVLQWATFLGGAGLNLMRATVRSDSTTFTVGSPRVVSHWPLAKFQGIVAVAESPDLERALLCKESGEPVPPVPTLILNWSNLVDRKK